MLEKTALWMLSLAAPFGVLVLVATDWFPAVAFAIPASMIGLSVLLLALQEDLEDANGAPAMIRVRSGLPPRRMR